MKKLSLICMMILAMLAMASCRSSKNNANVSSSTVSVYSNDWYWVNENKQWQVQIDYNAINSHVFNYGAVLVYMDVEGSWSQVPLTYYYQDVLINEDGSEELINCQASIEVATLKDRGVRLFWTESDFYDGARPGNHDFKIVVIDAAAYSNRSDVDYSDYNAVKTAFQLAD